MVVCFVGGLVGDGWYTRGSVDVIGSGWITKPTATKQHTRDSPSASVYAPEADLRGAAVVLGGERLDDRVAVWVLFCVCVCVCVCVVWFVWVMSACVYVYPYPYPFSCLVCFVG